MADFHVLGAVEAYVAGRPVEMGPPRQRTVLAALLVDAGAPVSTDTLVDRVWGEDPPAQARRSLQSHIARLRRLLAETNTPEAPTELLRRSGGYLMQVPPESVDLLRFRSLTDQARGAPDAERAALLKQALDLWRGEPLVGTSGEWALRQREHLLQQRLSAATGWAEAELRMGNGAALVEPLAELVADHPLAEPLAAAYLLALRAAGQGADALRHYAAVRARLADTLGSSPSAELQQAHQEVLRETPEPSSSPPRQRVVPAMLPLDVYGFAGRRAQLDELDEIVNRRADQPKLTTLSGTPGVGKTTLAVHWAHRIRHRYPDGQLYLNLRGFDPGGSAVQPAQAVRTFLDALGVPPGLIPADHDAQVGLYRSQLANRRVLVILDNARDAAQVRPLLPGSATAAALVTSRSHLASLVAVEGAHPLTMDLLSEAESRDLLSRRLGEQRVGEDPEAVRRIVASCARLPLALAIAAARAALDLELPLTVLADELTDALDALAGEDPVTDARAVFSWSYEALPEQAAALFRLLGLHPGPDFTVPAAASLAGLPPDAIRPVLTELAERHLVADQGAGRYALHDLLRAYAAELAGRIDPAECREAATDRLLDHYLHSAYAAGQLAHKSARPIELLPPAPGTGPEEPADRSAALAWLAAEHHVLQGTFRLAAASGRARHVGDLAWTLAMYLDRAARYQDLEAMQRVAIDVARAAGDGVAEGRAHRNLGRAHERCGRYAQARAELQLALDLAYAAGDLRSASLAERLLVEAYGEDGDYQEAIRRATLALDLERRQGVAAGVAACYNMRGWYRVLVGEFAEAFVDCQRALDIFGELADVHGLAISWDSMGYAHHRTGAQDKAIECYTRALALHREIGDAVMQADTLLHIGQAEQAAGDLAAARGSWQRALGLVDNLSHDHPLLIRLRAAMAA
jgi:DNA-binding SARP family transcriptional activator/Tfp pilus assembly protein PilF